MVFLLFAVFLNIIKAKKYMNCGNNENELF